MTPRGGPGAAAGVTEPMIADLVHAFYAKARLDPELGPIFNGVIGDGWDEHLAKLCDFWSSVLRGTARFSGTPMPKDLALPNLQASTFERWLELFHATTQELENEAMRESANEMAQRIAQSLWFGYQHYRQPDEALSTRTLTRPV